MSFDFSLILVIATVLSGLIWGTHAVMARSSGTAPSVVVEYARSFFPILLVVLLVRSFLFEPFRIPSSSMLPTLEVGDFIFVNKYTYGLRLPVTNTKILPIGEPKRGDVVVFKLPADPGTNYIKRLVGLPGDTIRYQNKRLYINDQPVSRVLDGRYPMGAMDAVLASEKLGDVDHKIVLIRDRRSAEGVFIVPPGHYFMMGDNRDNSRDSRYPGVGVIPEHFIVGKAVRIWMNWDFSGMPQWSRIGHAIR